jgi:hypothetical protein
LTCFGAASRPIWIEDQLRREKSARFAIEVDANGPSEADIRLRFHRSNLSIWQSHSIVEGITGHGNLIFHIREIRHRSDTTTPEVFTELEREHGVVRTKWREGS